MGQHQRQPPPAARRPFEGAPTFEFRLYRDRKKMGKSYASFMRSIKRHLIRHSSYENRGVPSYFVKDHHRIPVLPADRSKFFIVKMYLEGELEPVKLLFRLSDLYLYGIFSNGFWHLFKDAVLDGVSKESEKAYIRRLRCTENYGSITSQVSYKKLKIGFSGQAGAYRAIAGYSPDVSDGTELFMAFALMIATVSEASRFPFLMNLFTITFDSGDYGRTLDIIVHKAHENFSMHFKNFGNYCKCIRGGRTAPADGFLTHDSVCSFIGVLLNLSDDDEKLNEKDDAMLNSEGDITHEGHQDDGVCNPDRQTGNGDNSSVPKDNSVWFYKVGRPFRYSDVKGEQQLSADTDGGQLAVHVMISDDDEQGSSHLKDHAKGEQLQSSDVDEEQSPMNVDFRGVPSVRDEVKMSSSSERREQVPIEFNVGSLDEFCKASRSFFSENELISHRINSYADFLSPGLQDLFDSLREITVEPDYDPSKKICPGGWRHATIKFGRVDLEEPVFWSGNSDLEELTLKLKPKHARLEIMTYSSKMNVEMTAKAFIAEEQRCLSSIWIWDSPSWDAFYLSQIKREKIYVKLVHSKENDAVKKVINLFFLGATMPIWIVFFALGVTSDKEAFDMIDIQDCDSSIVNIISATVKDYNEQCESFRGRDKASQYVDEFIRKTRLPPEESFDEYIGRYMFPDVSGHRNKAFLLGYMVKCLLMAYTGNRKCDNKDDFRNKRLDLACQLLQRELWVQIRHLQKRMVKVMQRHLSGDGDLQALDHYVDAAIVTNGLSRAFSTGSWCHSYKTERCSGVVATLRRTNPLQMMSDLRKTRQFAAYWGNSGDASYPNPSFWGKLCFMSTPDGEKCGFVKKLAVTAVVSSVIKKPLNELFVSCGMRRLDEINLQELSGKDPGEFLSSLRNERRSKRIDPQVEIKRDKHHKEVRVFCDAGRILRPLLVVQNLKSIPKQKDGSYSFRELMDQNIIELIGVEEEEDIRCACGIRDLFSGGKEEGSAYYTHCELDPSFLVELSCGIIPFANHNAARRVLMQAEKLSQQAIGYSSTNSQFRVDSLYHQMYYPQRPLFKTVVADCISKRNKFGRKDDFTRPEYFNGQNAIVSVSVHQGFNQEGSLVLNRASLERGMFRTLHFKSYKAHIENKEVTRRLKHREQIDFGKIQSKRGRVDSLDTDGFPYVGASLQSGGIVIGKVSESGEDHSVKLMHTEKGMVEKVVLSANGDGKNSAVVTLRQARSPCVGDKFASMHDQKGVVGLLDSQEYFPFTCQGIVPDIVINPHGFPTRQTPARLLVAALGKAISLGGMTTYATVVTTPSVDVITEQLHKCVFSRWGAESVLNGQTGARMDSLVFMGPNFYQRRTHMAEDKVKFRNTGPVHPLTMQSVEDKKRFGGRRRQVRGNETRLPPRSRRHRRPRPAALHAQRLVAAAHLPWVRAGGERDHEARGVKVTGPYCGF